MVCVKERETMVCLKQTAMRDANEGRRELSPNAVVCYIHFLFFTELSGKILEWRGEDGDSSNRVTRPDERDVT